MREVGVGRGRSDINIVVLMYKILKKIKGKKGIDFMFNTIWTLIKTSI